MRFPILVNWHLYTEMALWCEWSGVHCIVTVTYWHGCHNHTQSFIYTSSVTILCHFSYIYMSNAGILYTQTNFVGVGSAYEYQFQRKYFITMQCMAMEVFLGNSYSAFRACVNYAPLGLIILGESTSHSVWRKYKINNWYYPKHFNLAPHTFMINNYWSLRINSVKTGNIKQCLWLKFF